MATAQPLPSISVQANPLPQPQQTHEDSLKLGWWVDVLALKWFYTKARTVPSDTRYCMHSGLRGGERICPLHWEPKHTCGSLTVVAWTRSLQYTHGVPVLHTCGRKWPPTWLRGTGG